MGQTENGTEETMTVSDLLNEKYQETLKSIIKEYFGSTASDCSIEIKPGSGKGDNYVGVLYRVTVKDPKKKEMSVIIKLPPQNLARREQFYARPCFLRESEFYDSIFPLYKKFQTDRGIIVEGEGFHEVPACFRSLTGDFNEGLFLEDLKSSGFEMFDRFDDVTAAHVNGVMKVLGKFHAISLAINDQQAELIEKYKDMQDIFFQRDDDSKEQIKVWFDHLKKQAATALNTIDNETLKTRAKKVLEADFFELLKDCISKEDAEPFSVICHGDCWNNNIMFKYEVNDLP